jgi:hypothetical protein
MNSRILSGMAALALLLGAVGQAKAALITSAGGIPPAQKIATFHPFSGGFTFTSGPVQIGGEVGEDITWSTTYGSLVIGNGLYGLASNGIWESARDGYTGLNIGNGDMVFKFNSGQCSGRFHELCPGLWTRCDNHRLRQRRQCAGNV